MPPAVSPPDRHRMCPPTLGLAVSRMLADQLDYVIGVDPHRDSHALAVVHVISGAIVFEANVAANSEGYAHALELVDTHAVGRRAFAVEGTGSFRAGLTRFLTGRVEQLLAEERELAREIETIIRRLAPQLLEQPGVGPHAAAQLVLSWSHRGRIGSEAAFARLAGAAPIPASSGQTIRYRLDRSGDRKLNRALHMILVTRKRSHPATIAYIERRLAEGKTRREANRCLKRYLARSLYRLLEHGRPLAT